MRAFLFVLDWNDGLRPADELLGFQCGALGVPEQIAFQPCGLQAFRQAFQRIGLRMGDEFTTLAGKALAYGQGFVFAEGQNAHGKGASSN
jgi:hypothetical protein